MQRKPIFSKLGLYYEYYLAQIKRKLLCTIVCKLVNLALKNNTPLEIWKSRVSIIFKKVIWNINITKVRAILLLKADFDEMDKIIFNIRVITTLEYQKSIPYQIIE